MTMQFRVVADPKAALHLAELGNALDALLPSMATGAGRLILQRGVREVQRSDSSGILGVRTGNLRRSWTEVALTEEATGGEARARQVLGTNMPYAAIHEDGGFIRPVNAKALTIPVGPALTGKGVPKAEALERMQASRSAGAYWKDGGYDFHPASGGSAVGLLGRWKGRNKDEWETWWILWAGEIEIRPTHYVTKGIELAARLVDEYVGKEIDKLLKQAGAGGWN